MILSAIWLVSMAIFGTVAASTESQAKVIVHDTAESPPVFKDLDKFMERNFKYPIEAWKEEKKNMAAVSVVILKDGTVSDIEFENIKHPLLKEELDKTIRKMKWLPAYSGGHPVNVRLNLMLPLRHETLWSDSMVPFGLEQRVNDAEKLAKNLFKHDFFSSQANITNATAELKEIHECFPANHHTSCAYAALTATTDTPEKSVAIIDNTFKEYHSNYRNADSIHAADGYETIVIREGYNGRNELGIVILRSLYHHYYGSDNSRNTFNDALSLIDQRIVDKDLNGNPSEKEQAAYNERINKMQRDMVSESTNGKLAPDRATPLWAKVTREYSINELSGALSYWNKKGHIDNAMVSQLNSRLDMERDEMIHGKGSKGDAVKLFGAKAFLIWAQEGDESLRKYVDLLDASNCSAQLTNYMKKLLNNLEKNSELLSDRNKAIESILCIAPDSNKPAQEASMFYKRREAVCKVFPLEWLMK